MPPPTTSPAGLDPERLRLLQDERRTHNWKRWGPYLSERQWSTVREDYSPDGDCWNYLPHDHARSRAYRWGEDGLCGFTDRECRLCFALALWNGKDPILKERLFGLTGPEGNHGEDVKEEYFYLDNTPTHSWMRVLYKYPQAEFPYQRLRDENRARGYGDREFELADAGVFADGRYFDVFVAYAKAAPDDVLVQVTVHNRGPEAARLHVLPQLWFRNTWAWGRTGEGYWRRGRIALEGARALRAAGDDLGAFLLELDEVQAPGRFVEALFTENETNHARLSGVANGSPFVKDGFHERVVGQRLDAVNPAREGTKAAFWCQLELPARGSQELRLRLRPADAATTPAFGGSFLATLARRQEEAAAFYSRLVPSVLAPDERRVLRQAYAGLLWNKQFYYFDVKAWLQGDPGQPAPARRVVRNREWTHLYNRDVVSMPDKWEYPWYAAWDLAFHMLPFARLDPAFSKQQLLLLLREWYMAPNGQLPAYEFSFSDVNPPVHAFAAWRVYKMTGPRGARDRTFLARAFHKLLLNFTWWVNRKDLDGHHVFGGGFLGLDNIGVFERGKPLPTGGVLEQADGTAWMACYCATMLNIALELASGDPAYEDVASKFFEHFVAISHAMNTLGGTGLWDEQDGFYYDQIRHEGQVEKLRIRSLVGLIPLAAVEVLEEDLLDRLEGFSRRMRWFVVNEPELAGQVTHDTHPEHPRGTGGATHRHVLLALPTKERLLRVLRYMLDEREFLSPFGVRSLSAAHKEKPFVLHSDGKDHRVDYAPGEGTSDMFGGNSNWRGPVWFPVNYLLIEALERYGHFYGDSLRVECPTGSGRMLSLQQVADELALRLTRLFVPGADGRRPFAGDDRRFTDDPHYQDLLWFHEFFHGDTGRGCGASHQTGWTSLVTRCLDKLARLRAAAGAGAGAGPAAGAGPGRA